MSAEKRLLAPDGSRLPLGYRWLLASTRLPPPWVFIADLDESRSLREEFRREIGAKLDVVPFARRDDRDDVAAFVVEGGRCPGRVISVHLTWSGAGEQAGWPESDAFDDVWDWLRRCVIEDCRLVGTEEAVAWYEAHSKESK